MSRSRLLYIDESLSKRVAALLRQRGRAAESASEAGLLGALDDPVLEAVYKDREDIVFVTADDGLPAEHGKTLREVGATVATIAPYEGGKWWSYRDGSHEEAWKREIVSRWAHSMQEQERRTLKRYYLNGGRRWVPRKRPIV